MRVASRVRSPLAVLTCVAAAALLACGALAQEDKKDKGKDKSDTSKKCRFNSFDGVELSGTFYPKPGGPKDKDACVLLLHNFDRVKGGNSHQDGWDHLAEDLQKDGYAVLSFDFRGFGDSKEVSREKFWDRARAHQNMSLPGAARAADTIDFKEFSRSYYPLLANDIAAARACLDHKNDIREVNSSNLIMVGAGEGATLGALWLATECKRKRSRGILADARLDLDDPECRDVACCVWLSISPTLGGASAPYLHRWLVEAGAEHHIPMGFLYGGDDRESKLTAERYVEAIKAASRKTKADLTAAAEIPNTKLRGSQLLTKSLSTEQLVKNYLDRVMDKRGVREPRSHDPIKTTYYWSFRSGMPVLAKSEQEELLRALPLSQMGVSSP
jgi:pimeloyl-ACP methyl ester carboxylesterase